MTQQAGSRENTVSFLTIQSVMEDFLRSGVSDFTSNEPFNLSEDSLERDPYGLKNIQTKTAGLAGEVLSSKGGSRAPRHKTETQPNNTALSATATFEQLNNQKSKAKPFDVDKHLWFSGNTEASIQIILSSESQKNTAPMSSKGTALLEKMLSAIGINIEEMGFIILNAFDASGQPHLEHNDIKLKEAVEKHLTQCPATHILLVGQDCARVMFHQTLHNIRHTELSIQNKITCTVMHPETLLKQPVLKRMAWQDLLKFQSMLKGSNL